MSSQEVVDLLDRVASSFEAGDYAAAGDAYHELVDAYRRVEPGEQAARTKAIMAVRDGGLSGPERQAAKTLISETVTTQIKRSGAVMSLSVGVVHPTRVDDADVLGSVAELRDSEQTYRSARADAEPALDAVSLPASVVAATATVADDVVPKGGSTTLTVTVANVGDEDGSATLELDAPDGVSLDRSSASVSVPADGTVEERFEAATSAAGEHDVTASVSGGDATGDPVETTVTVRSKAGYVEAGRESLALLDEMAADADAPRDLRAKLDRADARLAQAASFADAGRAKQANNMLNAASNVLGAFLNQLDGLSSGDGGRGNGGALSDAERHSLESAAERLVERLADARTAEL